jgi:hypothetical protein
VADEAEYEHRQPHGQDRAEGDEPDEDGGQEADALLAVEGLVGEDVTAQLDAQAGQLDPVDDAHGGTGRERPPAPGRSTG